MIRQQEDAEMIEILLSDPSASRLPSVLGFDL